MLLYERDDAPLEGRPSGDEREDRGAEAVEVGVEVHVPLAVGLLRRHVVGRAEELARDGETIRVRAPRDAEVRELDAAVRGDERVGGLQVPVDEPGAVDRLESARDLCAVGGRLAPGELRPLVEHRRERPATRDELEREPGDSLLLARGIDLRHVLVSDRRGRARLACEAARVGRVRADPDRDHLERDPAAEPFVLRLVDGSHAALAEEAEDAVAAEAGVRGKPASAAHALAR